MIIIDFQQIMLANLNRQLGNHQNAQLDENILRHMVLNSIRAIKSKFKDSEVVIACDSRTSWRRGVFPYYKANRAKKRQESELDWVLIFESFDKIIAELREFFPYRVIKVEDAEADDIVGVLSMEFGQDLVMGFDKNEIVIVSGDKDFKQLQRFANVRQWDHVQKKFVTCNSPENFLKEHIVCGDTGDGVPNFLSEDDTFVVSAKRQKPVQEKKLPSYISNYPDNPESERLLRNWKRNEQLIDLRFTPDEIRQQVLEQYHSQAGKTKAKLANYFIAKNSRISIPKLANSNMLSYKEIYEMKEPISHILTKAANLPKTKQAEFLKNHQKANLLAAFLQLAVNKNIKWLLPEGDPPYKAAEHDEWGILYQESRRMYLFLEGGHPTLNQMKRERIFIEMLESVHADDAKLLLLLKDQKLPAGLDEKQVVKAFPGIDGK